MLNELNNGNFDCLNQIWLFNCPYLVVYEQTISDSYHVLDNVVSEPNKNKGPFGMSGIAKENTKIEDIKIVSPLLTGKRGN